MIVLMVIVGCTCGFISIFMPRSLSGSLNKDLDEKALQLVDFLKDYTLENAEGIIGNSSNQNATRVVLTDENGTTIHEWNYDGIYSAWEEGDVTAQEGTFIATTTDEIEDTAEETVALGDTSEESVEEQAMGQYPVSFKEDEKSYILYVYGPAGQVNFFVAVINRIIPWAFLICFFISIIVSYFYSRYLTRPVKNLSEASQKMADLDFSIHTSMERKDELGCVAENLDCLARDLDLALEKLQAANSKLKSEQELEREQSQRTKEFLTAITHELKTPIAILKGQIEGMKDNIGAYKDRDKYLARANMVAKNFENMVQEISVIAEIGSADFHVKKKETDLAELVRSEAEELSGLMEEKNMELTLSLPTSCKCLVDPDLMEMVIRNLLVNALRYSPAGEKIKVELYENEQKKETVFQIENNGVHIPEKDLVRIFDAFYRVEASRNKATGGNGLGLYIVREILEQHNAWYEMTNTKEGVLFQFKIANGTCNL